MNMMQLPGAVADWLHDDCIQKLSVENAVRGRFAAFGYDEISPAGVELYDTFAHGVGARRQEQMLKTFDAQGRILVMRPEFTTPIARMVSTKMRDIPPPLRLCYVGNAYANPYPAGSGRKMEFTQGGVELLGLSDERADAEVVALSIEAMKAAGLTHCLIEIGQVDFFKGLMEEAGLGEENTALLRTYVEEKNLLAIELMLRECDVSGHVAQCIMQLPTLFGGAEVFARAEKLSASPRCRAALANLRAIYDALCACGYEEYVSIDLGMVHAIGYYTGMIFRGMSSFFGKPLLSGGRYDELLGQCGRPLCATGFAMGIEYVLAALAQQGIRAKAAGPEVLLVVGDRPLASAWAQAQCLREQGLRVELCYEKDAGAIAAIAARRGCARIEKGE